MSWSDGAPITRREFDEREVHQEELRRLDAAAREHAAAARQGLFPSDMKKNAIACDVLISSILVGELGEALDVSEGEACLAYQRIMDLSDETLLRLQQDYQHRRRTKAPAWGKDGIGVPAE